MERKGHGRRRVRRVALAGGLGLLTCLGIAGGVAAGVPIDKAGGTVSRDGDHLQPWLLRLAHWSGDRTIWFEKGRVYNRGNVGPPGASSAAVSCWSFATATRQNPAFAKGDITISAAMQASIDEPIHAWGAAQERRGWPWPALSCRIVGRLSAPSGEGTGESPPNQVYVVEGGVPFNFDNLTGQSQSLATARVIPLAPAWGGLLADSIVLGAGWWAVLLAVGSLSTASRRAARIRRGRCPRCAYDLKHEMAGGCPECGWNRAAGDSPAADQTRSRA